MMLKGQSFAGLARSPPLRFARQPGAGEVFFKEINATSRHFDVKRSELAFQGHPKLPFSDLPDRLALKSFLGKRKKKTSWTCEVNFALPRFALGKKLRKIV